MAEKLDEVGKALATQTLRLDSYKGEVKASVQRQVKASSEDFYMKLNEDNNMVTFWSPRLVITN